MGAGGDAAMDLNGMSPDELRTVIHDAAAVLTQLERIDQSRTDVAEAVSQYAVAAGVTVESAWLALCPLPVEVEPAPAPVPDAPEWQQPAGAQDAYSAGTLVTYKGVVYESLLAGNAFSPAAFPQGWRKL